MKLTRGVIVACGLAAALCFVLAPKVARGGPSPSPPPVTAAAPVVNVSARAIFGDGAASGDGWIEVVARVENLTATAIKGTLELTGMTSGVKGKEVPTIVRAPFHAPASTSVVVHLPAHAPGSTPGMSLRALDEGGKLLSTVGVPVGNQDGPLVVDVSPTPRLALQMRGWPMTPTWFPYGTFSAGSPYLAGTTTSYTLTLASPRYDATTGNPVLPDRAAGYASVSALIVHSDTLAKLEGEPLEAMINWVLSGGTLAVVMSRPEDLRNPTVASLVGGVVSSAPAPRGLWRLEAKERENPSEPSFGSGPSPFGPLPPLPTTPPPPTYPRRFGTDSGLPIQYRPPGSKAARLGPLAPVGDTFAGFAGGNLRESHFGMSAPYGLGEVHLLAFDPTVSPGLDDLWVQNRVVEMAERGFERHAAHVFPHGGGNRRGNDYDAVRRALDPEESFRPALALAAAILVLYAIVVGPVTFLRAAKRGRPLDPLLWVPILSLLALSAVVVVGLAGKGWRGRARRLSLVEAGGGMSRGPVRRFRAFYSGEPRSLVIRGSERGGVLDLAGGESAEAALRLDKNAVSLEGTSALPWQSILVSEQGFLELAGGVAVVPSPDGSADVINRTGRDLKDVLVHVPGQSVTYFEDLKDGDRVHASTGKPALLSSKRPRGSGTARPIHKLDTIAMKSVVPSAALEAWHTFADAGGNEVDWWPDDEMVVMGEVVGGERVSSDARLTVDSDRLYFRVVGAGGAP